MASQGCNARLANQLHRMSLMRHFFKDLIDTRMQTEDLIQLACLLAISPPKINRTAHNRLSGHISDYWTASRDRLDRWTFHLPPILHSASASQCTTQSDAKVEKDPDARTSEHAIPNITLITEMILSEPLSRIWAAIVANHQKIHNDTDSVHAAGRFKNPTGDILDQHSMLIQNTVDNLEHYISDKKSRQLVKIILRRSRRWSDLLLAHMEQSQPASHYASDPTRCLNFAEDLRFQWSREYGARVAAATISSARQVICESTNANSFSPYLNYRIGAAVLQSCASDDLKPSGLFPPHSTVRLWAAFARCETMLSLALEDRSMPIAMPVE